MKNIRSALPFIFFVLLALTLHLWAITRGHINFTSDQALGGLVVQQALRGEWHTYLMGQRYFGNVWIPFVAPLFLLFGKNSIVALRLPFFLMTGVFFAVFLLFVHRAWGRRAAIITSALMAVPGFQVFYFLFFGPYNFWGPILAACLLLMAFPTASGKRPPAIRAAVFGGLVGLGLWVTPIFKLSALAMGTVLLLASQEWSSLYGRIERLFGRYRRVFLIGRIAAMIVLYRVATAPLFTTSTPQERVATKWILMATAVIVPLVLFLWSRRKKCLFILTIFFLLGLAIGNVPQWMPWVLFGTFPSKQILFLGPSLDALKSLFDTILPALWGATVEHPISLWGPLGHSWSSILRLGMVNAIATIGVLAFLTRERSVVFSLATGKPLPSKHIPTALLLLLFLLPLFALYSTGIALPMGQVRFVLSAWPAGMVILALSFEKLIQKRRMIGGAVLLFFLAQVGWSSASRAYSAWKPLSSPFPPEAVRTLATTLVESEVQGGYASFWIGYALNFLFEDRLVFSSFQGDKDAWYRDRVRAMRRFAIIIPAKQTVLPNLPTNGEKLTAYLEQWRLVQQKDVYQRIRRSTLEKRYNIEGLWDVWIFEDPASGAPPPP